MKEWQKSLIIILIVPAGLLLFLVIYNGPISGAAIDDSSECRGKHNIVIFADSVSWGTYVNNISTYIFLLPEAHGFVELYRKFEVTGGEVVMNCTVENCGFYVNGNACLTNLPYFQYNSMRTYSIDNCTKYFHDGVNTVDARWEGVGWPIRKNFVSLYLETEIVPARC